MLNTTTIAVGNALLHPMIDHDELQSLGEIVIAGTRVRNPATRFLPWFDTYEGDIFRRFHLQGIEQIGDNCRLALTAISDPDALFRERRDSSGDLCFRARSWDAPAQQADLHVVFAPVEATIDGYAFDGFKYWYEYQSDAIPIHRMVDRQTWEIGGNLDDVTICLRNWLTPPRMRITRETTYSTVGLDQWAALLPGNLWARWTLLPSFDMQYGAAGVLLGWFDEVSLIRTVIESETGEDALRVLDMHLFEQSTTVCTNPKTILRCPEVLDETDALNLWTRIVDLEYEKSSRQFGIRPQEAPPIVFHENVWRGVRFDTTYEHVVETAAEFGADYVFIDSVWEHQQAYAETLDVLIPAEKKDTPILKKFWHQNMCVTLDFEVADILGGEMGLKALCERAQTQGVRIISWMATHYSPNTTVQFQQGLGHGQHGIFASRESGRHPDTGYPASCWTANLNAPVTEKITEQVLGVCQRTGLAGYLWDSVSNMGWWTIDYSNGTMRPQFDRMADLFAKLVNAGLYIQPEGLLAFSTSSCCGLHGGNIYADDLLGYSYNTTIALWFGSPEGEPTAEIPILRGQASIDMLFQCVAYKRIPNLHFHTIPRDEWDPQAVVALKELFAVYKQFRHLMQKRTVLKHQAGVLWENETENRLFFSFQQQPCPVDGVAIDAASGEVVHCLMANRAYRILPR